MIGPGGGVRVEHLEDLLKPFIPDDGKWMGAG